MRTQSRDRHQQRGMGVSSSSPLPLAAFLHRYRDGNKENTQSDLYLPRLRQRKQESAHLRALKRKPWSNVSSRALYRVRTAQP